MNVVLHMFSIVMEYQRSLATETLDQAPFSICHALSKITVKPTNKDRPWEEQKRSLFTGGALFGGLSTDAIFIRVHTIFTILSV